MKPIILDFKGKRAGYWAALSSDYKVVATAKTLDSLMKRVKNMQVSITKIPKKGVYYA